jgi:arylsulfatase A
MHAEYSKPNVILIMADDLGYEALSCNGADQIKTPNLDRLAKNGVRFTNAFANPLCTPTRVKIMTGLYNVKNYIKFAHLPLGEKTFGHFAKEAGYKTCVAGKWQIGYNAKSYSHFGFDEACLWQQSIPRWRSLDGVKYDSRFVSPLLEINGEKVDYLHTRKYGPDVCADFICSFIEKNKSNPFFAYYPMILTHCPFDPTPDSDDWDAKRLGSTDNKGDLNRHQKHFIDMVQYMDKIVGKIEQKLFEHGIRNNTVILFTGDNGTDNTIKTQWNGSVIHGKKGSLTDRGTRVPLIANFPGTFKENFVSEDLFDFTDFMPTLLELFHGSLPANYSLDGISLLPTLKEGKNHDRSFVYMWYEQGILARNKNFKYQVNLDFTNPSFWDVKIPYKEKKLPIDSLNENQQSEMLRLKEIVEDMEKTRPSHLGPMKPRVSKSNKS